MGNDVEKQKKSSKVPTTGSAWSGFWLKLKKLLPFMWPSKHPLLQLRVALCVALIISVRVINVYVPIYQKKIVNALDNRSGYSTWPWDLVVVWTLLKLLQGGGIASGLLDNLRTFLWIKVQQYTALSVQVSLFEHIHNLSLRWHLQRKTGEVVRIMERGTNSINNLLQYLVFNIIPTMVDIVVAIVYFCIAFNLWFGLIILIAMILYLASTVMITEWRTEFRRKMNLMENEQRTRGVDSLLNAETVKYFAMESWEAQRYEEAILKYQKEEGKTSASLSLLNIVQCFILNGALLALSLYGAFQVWQGELTVGDFVQIGSYFMQLMSPLNWIGTLYRVIQESFVNMENMFELMDEEVEVKDLPTSKPFVPSDNPPQIEFHQVSFSHNETKPVLQDLSFQVPSGTTTALVGTSGSGKTTIAKLLFRLFDVDSGKITFDGENIRNFNISSLRSFIGVVPQDTVLFNDTIMYNIRYGKISATDEEVKTAAKLADIHEIILGFPDGYETLVGERGLKLSGGEKQRVAIARTLLRDPKVMILDEATSSLDSQTERSIQEGLDRLAKEGQRSVVVVAHRLSTITRAEQILVLEQGEIVERGNHEGLISKQGGVYANLWEHQDREIV